MFVELLDFVTMIFFSSPWSFSTKLGTLKNFYILFYFLVSVCLLRLTLYRPMLLFHTPWKHQKTFRFSDVFRGYRKATPGCNGLNNILSTLSQAIIASVSKFVEARTKKMGHRKRMYACIVFVCVHVHTGQFSPCPPNPPYPFPLSI